MSDLAQGEGHCPATARALARECPGLAIGAPGRPSRRHCARGSWSRLWTPCARSRGAGSAAAKWPQQNALESSQRLRPTQGEPRPVPQKQACPITAGTAWRDRPNQPGPARKGSAMLPAAPLPPPCTRVAQGRQPDRPDKKVPRPPHAPSGAHHDTQTPLPAGPDGAPQSHRGEARPGKTREQLWRAEPYQQPLPNSPAP